MQDTTLAKTITAKRTASYKLKSGTCQFCFCHGVTLTHNVKYAVTGRRLSICTKCASVLRNG